MKITRYQSRQKEPTNDTARPRTPNIVWRKFDKSVVLRLSKVVETNSKWEYKIALSIDDIVKIVQSLGRSDEVDMKSVANLHDAIGSILKNTKAN